MFNTNRRKEVIIKKGTILNVRHTRSGKWTGIATQDFDTELVEFYPIALAQEEIVEGLTVQYLPGDNMPCRKSLCTITILEKEKK